MLKAHINNENEIISIGVVKVDDVYPSYCCAGFDWLVCLIFPYEDDRGGMSIWGVCQNPNCPDWDGTDDDYYRGVSNICLEDFAERLIEGQPRFVAQPEG
jgi:hypothetical protein